MSKFNLSDRRIYNIYLEKDIKIFIKKLKEYVLEHYGFNKSAHIFKEINRLVGSKLQ